MSVSAEGHFSVNSGGKRHDFAQASKTKRKEKKKPTPKER